MNDRINYYGPRITANSIRETACDIERLLAAVKVQASALADENDAMGGGELDSLRRKLARSEAEVMLKARQISELEQKNEGLRQENEGLRRELAVLRELAGA